MKKRCFAAVVFFAGTLACGRTPPMGGEASWFFVPEAPWPGAPPTGDCHGVVGPVGQLFSPFEMPGSNVPGSRLALFEDQLYASLVTETNGSLALFRANLSEGSSWERFVTLPQVDDTSELLGGSGSSHLYWSTGVPRGEWQVPLVTVGYRSGGEVSPVSSAQVLEPLSALFVHDDVSYAFHCTLPGSGDECLTQPGALQLTATRVPSGEELFSQALPASLAAQWFNPAFTVDDEYLYWSAGASVGRVPLAGGEAVVLPLHLPDGEQVVGLSRTSSALAVATRGGRDAAVTNELALYRFPVVGGALGAPVRSTLGRTYLEQGVVAFDGASIYFTYDVGADSPLLQTRTLARACLDGTNLTPIIQGFAYGQFSVQALALTSRRGYFTAQNRVYAFDK